MSCVASGWWLISLAGYRRWMGAESMAYFNRDGEALLRRATLRRKAPPRGKGNARCCMISVRPMKPSATLRYVSWKFNACTSDLPSRCRRAPARGTPSYLGDLDSVFEFDALDDFRHLSFPFQSPPCLCATTNHFAPNHLTV